MFGIVYIFKIIYWTMMTKTKYLGFALKYSKEKREQKEEYMNQKENIIFCQSTICRHLLYHICLKI